MKNIIGRKILINGIVQGVGFRPFIYNLANQRGLFGWVKNTSAGVEIQVEGKSNKIDGFIKDIKTKSPPLAIIDSLTIQDTQTDHLTHFEIIKSQRLESAFQPVSPDIGICPDCLDELFDPTDRRYLYPFINCTNCGPRYTIIMDTPYDRPLTTMAGFQMCSECASEYTNPNDRRFHAQPIACPRCGPKVWLEYTDKPGFPDIMGYNQYQDSIQEARNLLAMGYILGIKGLGGFHLACDALNQSAVENLRTRKNRIDKPFALMFFDTESIAKHCFLNDHEKVLLESPQRPIVILNRKPGSGISRDVAPNQQTIGAMLPYTPLHYLLLGGSSPTKIGKKIHHSFDTSILVMTSGNFSEEPIAKDNGEAQEKLGAIADAFLMHDRPILIRCDDSVTRNVKITAPTRSGDISSRNVQIYPLRRSRGYAPNPIHLPTPTGKILAVGAELKNTFCITREKYAFVSQHIGDLTNYETFVAYKSGIQHAEKLYKIRPDFIAYDLHPDYLSTKYAKDRAQRDDLPSYGIQHHHAHIVSCMLENELHDGENVIGVAFDGTGYGTDGAIWGGEFLLASYRAFKRVAHLEYVPLPGGDIAIRKPARIGLAYLWHSGIEWSNQFDCVNSIPDQEKGVILNQLIKNVNAPLTSSMGRLFDAVAAISGVRQEINYEAQASIELEALADPNEGSIYPYTIRDSTQSPYALSTDSILIGVGPIINSISNDIKHDVGIPVISARFHNTIAQLVNDMCCRLRDEYDCNHIVLSGGVWQNMVLLTKTLSKLEKQGFSVLIHRQVPTNDGGVSLGQVAIAMHNIG